VGKDFRTMRFKGTKQFLAARASSSLIERRGRPGWICSGSVSYEYVSHLSNFQQYIRGYQKLRIAFDASAQALMPAATLGEDRV
jgi:hypothetical protein